MNKLLAISSYIFIANFCYALEYIASSFNPYEYISKCQAGGTLFKSQYYHVTNLYLNFEKVNPKCSDKYKQPNLDLYNEIMKINDQSSEYTKLNNCPEIAKISRSYLNQYSQTQSRISTDKEAITEATKAAAKKPNIQIESSHIAWTLLMCASSHTSEDLDTRLNYLKDLQTIIYKKPPIKVISNGEILDDCKNVVAQGSDDLENFYVNLKGSTSPNVELSYNTFTVPDHITIHDSEKNFLLDSSCVGTEANVDRSIAIPDLIDKRIKISVDGKCKNKSSGTYWELHLSCGPSEQKYLPYEEQKRRKFCNEKAQKMIDTLKKNTNHMITYQQAQWMQAICQKGNYKKVMPDLVNPEQFYSTHGNVTLIETQPPLVDDYQNIEITNGQNTAGALYEGLKKKKNLLKNGILQNSNRNNRELTTQDNQSKTSKLMTKKVTQNKKIDYSIIISDLKTIKAYQLLEKDIPKDDSSLSSVPPLKKHLTTPFHYGYDDFIKNKVKYCPTLPTIEHSIFKQISYTYCHQAYPRLFDVGDDK